MHHSYLDKYARCDSPIHRVDARVKLLLALALVVLIAVTPQPGIAFIILPAGLIALLCRLARIPYDYLLRRSAVVLPFSGFAALSIALTYPGPEPIWQWGPLALNEMGLRWASALLLRSWLAVSALILLINTCSFDRLLGALRSYRAPGVLVLLLSFLYRFLYLLWDEAERLQRARNLRYFGGRRRAQPALLGTLAGTLFLRSYDRAERVQQAMTCRGWDGEARFSAEPRWSGRETALLCAALPVFAALWLLR